MDMPARGFTRFRGLILTLALFGALAIVFVALIYGTQDSVTDAQAQLLEDALKVAAVNCYATEGSYPATVEELKQKYGVIMDEAQFIVYYDIFASNIMPHIRVSVRESAR